VLLHPASFFQILLMLVFFTTRRMHAIVSLKIRLRGLVPLLVRLRLYGSRPSARPGGQRKTGVPGGITTGSERGGRSFDRLGGFRLMPRPRHRHALGV
jgi:hypothetical protein